MANSFMDTITGVLSSLFTKKQRVLTATGIDIGSSSIKLVELSLKNGKIILNTYGSIALGPYANAEIGQTPAVNSEIVGKALAEILKECKASAINTAVTLPTSASLFRDITVPAKITDEETKTVATTEARKAIPVPISEVDIDWLPIPEDIIPVELKDITKKHLLLVAVSNESQRKYDSYMKAANINPSLYEIEVFSSMRSIYSHERAPIALIDIGASHVKVCIIHEGLIRRAISMDRGFNELENALVVNGMSFVDAHKLKQSSSITGTTKEEEIMRETYTSLIKDIQVILNEYERYSHSSVTRAVLLGGGAEMKNIVSFTESVLGIPTEKSHPFSRTEVPDIVHDVVNQIEPEFTIATGVAMRLLTQR